MLVALWFIMVGGVVLVGFTYMGLLLRQWYLENKKKGKDHASTQQSVEASRR